MTNSNQNQNNQNGHSSSSPTSPSKPLSYNLSTGSFHAIPLQNLTSEGWLELFLTPAQKRTFSSWKEHIQDKSITHRITDSLMTYITTQFLPLHLAPNMITLTGFVSLGQAWYITNNYGKTYPISCTWFSLLNILLFYMTNCIDSIQANQLKQCNSLRILFKYCTDCNTTVFLILLTSYCLGGQNNLIFQWYAVQSSQLVLFIKHLSAYQRNAGLRYNVLTGPGEVIAVVFLLLILRGTLGLDLFLNFYHDFVVKCIVKNLYSTFDYTIQPNHVIYDFESTSTELMMMVYYMLYITAIFKIMFTTSFMNTTSSSSEGNSGGSSKKNDDNNNNNNHNESSGWTKFGLCTCLLMRLLPGLFIKLTSTTTDVTSADVAVADTSSLSVLDVICDGFFMALLTTDLTLAKMAGREIHPWVVLMSFCAVLSYSTILTLVAVYYIAVFCDLCSFLNMPLLTVCKNVYCDGVYDLCHVSVLVFCYIQFMKIQL